MPKEMNLNPPITRLRRTPAALLTSGEFPTGIVLSRPRHMTLRERFIEDGKKIIKLPHAPGKIATNTIAVEEYQTAITTDETAPSGITTQQHTQTKGVEDNTLGHVITKLEGGNIGMTEKARYTDAATTARVEMCDAGTQTNRHDGGIDPAYLRELLIVASESVKKIRLDIACFEDGD